MTQTTNRFFDEIGRLMNDAAGAAQGVKREFDTAMRAQAERILRDLDVVKRDEFEAVKEMAALARNPRPRRRPSPRPSRRSPASRRRPVQASASTADFLMKSTKARSGAGSSRRPG